MLVRRSCRLVRHERRLRRRGGAIAHGDGPALHERNRKSGADYGDRKTQPNHCAAPVCEGAFHDQPPCVPAPTY